MKKSESELLGRICYGFVKDEAGQVHIDEQQTQVVFTLFEKYLNVQQQLFPDAFLYLIAHRIAPIAFLAV